MFLKNNKGIVLIACYLVIVALTILGSAFLVRSISEKGIAERERNSIQAFYLAEAGIGPARIQLGADWDNRASLGGSLGEGTYNVDIFDTDNNGDALPGSKLRVRSTGTLENISRTVEVILKSFAGPGGVTSAIETEGNLTIKGSVTITGDIKEEVDLDFESIFGVNKTEMEEIIRRNGTYYNAAFDNDTATGLTWISAAGIESQITTNTWTGDGILIVNGDLKITGGTFNGVIWVIGALRISGNPVINGGMFVESSVTVDTEITGNAEINFSSGDVENAFGELSSLPPTTESWQELFE